MSKTPDRKRPRFADHLTEASKLFGWLNPIPLGHENRERRVEILTQLEIAQQARIANLLTIATTAGMPQAAKVLATFELFEEVPGGDGTQARLRPDVVLALGIDLEELRKVHAELQRQSS